MIEGGGERRLRSGRGAGPGRSVGTEPVGEAVVYTGFNGFLTLTPALTAELGLPFLTTNPAFLADGSEVLLDVHSATVPWDGRPKQVDVQMSDATPLVGMLLLDGHDLSIRVLDGGAVVIQPVE